MDTHIWTGSIQRTLLPLVEYHYQFGSDLDSDWHDPEIPHTVGIAQVLSPVFQYHGVYLPHDDRQLIELLSRRGRRAPGPRWWTLLTHADGSGRVGISAPGGGIESAGEHLALVTQPRDSRYADAWFLPGVRYMGGA